MKANAVVFPSPNEVEWREVECPAPAADDVVVRVTHSWISNGTEGSYLRGERIAGDTPYRPGDPVPFPVVAGYQKVGVVEWVGSDVHDLQVGETVFAAIGKVLGMFESGGGHVSPSVTPRQHVWKLPAGVDPLAFSGLVLTQVGYNCGSRAPLGPGGNAVVIGDGLVGQWAAQTLAWRGARVVLVGRHDDRLARFVTAPDRHTVNASAGDWVEPARRFLSQPVQIVVDTAGSIKAVEQSMALLARRGHVVSAGFYGTDDRLALQPLRAKELSVHMVSGWAQARMDQTLDLVAQGRLQTLPLITHRFPVSQAAEAWRLIREKSEPVLGVILDWPDAG